MLFYDFTENEKHQLCNIYEKIANLLPKTDEEIVFMTKSFMSTDLKKTIPLFSYLYEKFISGVCRDVVILSNIPKVEQSNILTVLLGFMLGEVIKEYDGGVWVKTIKADVKLDNIVDSPSSKDRKEFLLHTDLSYIKTPPKYFLFHCLSNPEGLGGMTTICGLHDVLSELSTNTKEILLKPEFRFPAPSYYISSGYITQPILSENNLLTTIRFRQDGMRFLSRNSVNAVVDLLDALNEKKKVIVFKENTAMYINNHSCLHGRYAFLTSNKANEYRHFNQVYIKE